MVSPRRQLCLLLITIVGVNAITLPNQLKSQVEMLLKQTRQEAGVRNAGSGHPELLTEEQQKLANTTTLEGDMELTGSVPRGWRDPSLPEGIGLDVVADKTKLWPNNRVPYQIDTRFSEAQKSMIHLAMKAFHDDTCIKFVPKTDNDENYLYVRRVTIGCYSPVGYENKPRQWVSYSPSCFDMFGSIIHELMHVIGFFHAQSREDRDQWVTVNWDKIQSSATLNFQKLTSAEIDEQNQPYDYGSLMHYPADGFAKVKGDITLQPKTELPEGVKMGQRVYFSELDKRKINILYNCQNASICAEGEVQCPSGSSQQCGKKCDGVPQCSDGSDEQNCPKPTCEGEDFWACDTLKCIRSSWLCDGTRDCPNGEDEKSENCKSRQCAKTELNCGKCVPAYRLCDGVQDCAMNQDEDETMCSQRNQQRQPQPAPTPPPQQPMAAPAPQQGARGQMRPQLQHRQPVVQQQQPQQQSLGWSNLWPYLFASRQPFRLPLQNYFNPSGYFNLLYDPLPTAQRHCFINIDSLSDRPELRLTPDLIKFITYDSDPAFCNVISLGYATINPKTLQISLGNAADNDDNNKLIRQVTTQLAKAKEDLRTAGTIIVIGSDASTSSPALNELRTIGDDVDKAQKLATQAAVTLRKLNATGLTLQWLKPRLEDRPALTTLIKSFASAFQLDPALQANAKAGNGNQIQRLIFGLNVVADVQSGQSKQFILDNTDYLNVLPDRDEARTTDKTFFTNQLLSSLGAPAAPARRQAVDSWLADAKNFKRMNIGIQFAPQSWTTATNDSNIVRKVGAPVRSPGAPQPLSGTVGTMNAGEVCLLQQKPARRSIKLQQRTGKSTTSATGPKGWQKATDSANNGAAYAYYPAERQWVAYETADSLQAKVKKANLKRFNGVYFMDVQNDDVRGLCGDDKQYELLKAMTQINQLSGLQAASNY